MINPINHGGSEEAIAAYKVEPYVVAADVYAVAPHTGRGGWTWYTGSAGWMYRFVLESMLGVQIHAHKLSFKPCLPPDWDGFSLRYRHHDTLYSISVRQLAKAGSGTSVTKVLIDGIEQPEPYLTLVDDRQDHDVEIRISTGSVGRVEAAV